jgi:hypothetical protein
MDPKSSKDSNKTGRAFFSSHDHEEGWQWCIIIVIWYRKTNLHKPCFFVVRTNFLGPILELKEEENLFD